MPASGPLRYLIGSNDKLPMQDGCIYEFSYDASRGDTAYGNLRDEKGRFSSWEKANQHGAFAPYLPPDDISRQYGEYTPDPRYGGYLTNILQQVHRKKDAGCVRIELDNPDSLGLDIWYVIDAMEHVSRAGLRNVAKNPLLVSDPERYISHRSVDLIICERDVKQTANNLDDLRTAIGKPDLAVRFVAYIDGDDDGTDWAEKTAHQIEVKGYRNMGVTISNHGEYTDSVDVFRPVF